MISVICMVFSMLIGQGMQTIDGLLPGMFSKSPIPHAVSWCSKKQATVAKSTTEAEYVALSQATQEAIYLRKLLADLGCKADSPTVLKEDNQGAIELPRNPRFHNITKNFHFIRETIASNEVKVVYCPSNDMLADVMTKGLARDRFQKLRNLLNIMPARILIVIFCYLS